MGEWGKGGGIAAYNLTGKKQSYTFKPADIADMEVSDQYWVYDYFGKKVFVLNRNEDYKGVLEADEFAWFVILPKRETGACLGLMNKYAGFIAVESIQEHGNTMNAIIKESGQLGWMSERAPQKVMAGASDVTSKVQKEGNLYSVLLPEVSSKVILTILW